MKPSKPQPEPSPTSGSKSTATVYALLMEPEESNPRNAQLGDPSQSNSAHPTLASWTCPHCFTEIPVRAVIRKSDRIKKIILCMDCGQPVQFIDSHQLAPLPPILELEFWAQHPEAVNRWREIERRRRARALDAAIEQEANR